MRRFVRDIDLHGHHRLCPEYTDPEDLGCAVGCICAQLDMDDYYDAGDRAMDERRENPRERTEYDD